ncbi:amidase [Paenibacillus oryzisoli]|uniref:amidase n=1 Tax=Paenibacillus oryzisoli TaxID=1850517 RepID=UPI003D288A60
MEMADRWNAYVNEDFIMEPLGTGRLHGFSFAVKDVFGLTGWTNTAGNPDWHRTHGPSTGNASSIDLLLRQGATLHGITHTDELMFSLNGENHHYGTPVNPRAQDRVPGGSSSGSAVAAAAGGVDFAIGTDTGGSVRIPSAYCGLYGMRPTHGAVSMDGVIPLSASFDTVGWMARSSRVLLDVGEALLPPSDVEREDEAFGFRRAIFGKDAWELTDVACRQAMENWLSGLGAPWANAQSRIIAPAGLQTWFQTFRTIQGFEIWQQHGEWITAAQPHFGPGIAERFAWSSTLSRSDFEAQLVNRALVQASMAALLGEDGLLVVPTIPCGAPMKGMNGDVLEDIRMRTMQLSCIAGLSGFPQVTVPAGEVDGVPIAVSFIAGKGLDVPLLRWVHRLTSTLQPTV